MGVWHGDKDNESTKIVRSLVSRARVQGLAPPEIREKQSTKKEKEACNFLIAFACYYMVFIEFLIWNNPRNITITILLIRIAQQDHNSKQGDLGRICRSFSFGSFLQTKS